MDTVLLTILGLLFVITIFLSLYHSNNIKVKQEFFGPPFCGTERTCCPNNSYRSCPTAWCKWNATNNKCVKR